MKGRGLVISPMVVNPPWDPAGLQVAGAGQLAIVSEKASWPTAPDASKKRAKNETARMT